MSSGEQENIRRFAQDYHWLEARYKVLEGRRAFSSRMEESLKAFREMENSGRLEVSEPLTHLRANCEQDLINARTMVSTAEDALSEAAKNCLSLCLETRFGEGTSNILETTLDLNSPEELIRALQSAIKAKSPEEFLGIGTNFKRLDKSPQGTVAVSNNTRSVSNATASA